MTGSVFADKATPPTAQAFTGVLGKAAAWWEAVKTQIPAAVEEWKYYSSVSGWTLVVKQKKRTIVYVTPLAGAFRLSFAYGEKAVQAACASDLPQELKNTIEQARKYVEGRAVRYEVRTKAGVAAAKTLVRIKQEN